MQNLTIHYFYLTFLSSEFTGTVLVTFVDISFTTFVDKVFVTFVDVHWIINNTC